MMNSLLRFYSPEDFAAVIPSFVRNGYRCMTWAELDEAQRVVYFIQLLPIDLEKPEPKKEKVILNEELTDADRGKE